MHFTASLLASAAAPVVDIDGTAFVQLGIFMLLMLILQPLLFRPWLETRERRAQSIAGAVAEADRLRTRADALGSEYAAGLAAAKEEAASIRSDSHRISEADRARMVASARADAGRDLELAREKAAREADEARQALGTQIDGLAREVASKVLGRAV